MHVCASISHISRKKWNNASLDQIDSYKSVLNDKLSVIEMPNDCLNCENVLCNNNDHANLIQQMHDDIISACIDASENIPSTRNNNNKLPGWNEFVKREKETALFWRSIWINNGSPRQGYVADIMRRTRAKYHYAIRRIKNNSQLLKKRAMARSVAENNSRQLWEEVRQLRNSKSCVTNCMDKKTGCENIAELFSEKYSELYNSVSYETDQLATITNNNMKDITMYCMNAHNCNDSDNIVHTHYVTHDQVQCAINKIKPGKSDCIDGMLSDNFKNGTPRLNTCISLLFTAMLVHGIAPGALLLSTLVPIPKNKRGNKSDSSNYRAIAISSLLGKIFDIIVLTEQCKSLETDNLQFGFKKHSSTVICTALLLETIEYYIENGSDCYLLLLDASKAFDRVEYVKLFNTLRDRKMCPIVLRLIMNMYTNQEFQVKWNTVLSSKCKTSNGVKQGGCLSPSLFSVYLNNLIVKLRNSNIGCRYRSEYMGVFGYADDLSLLCPSFSGIREMLNVCESYANENKIIFNASKSQILHFSKNEDSENRRPQLRMNNGQLIPYVEKCIHLGNILSSTSREQAMITSSITDLNIKTNNLLSEFSFNESTTLSRLFSSYCMNVYGSSLWRYNNLRNIECFCISWRKAIRKLWKIPYRTHNDLVYLINKCDPIVSILEKRCAKFLWNLFNSDNVLFSRICRYSVYNSDTAMGENIRYFMYKYNISYNDWYGNLSNIYVKIDTHVRSITNYDNICIAGAIRELCEARDSGVPQFVDATQLNSMIDILCTK